MQRDFATNKLKGILNRATFNQFKPSGKELHFSCVHHLFSCVQAPFLREWAVFAYVCGLSLRVPTLLQMRGSFDQLWVYHLFPHIRLLFQVIQSAVFPYVCQLSFGSHPLNWVKKKRKRERPCFRYFPTFESVYLSIQNSSSWYLWDLHWIQYLANDNNAWTLNLANKMVANSW